MNRASLIKEIKQKKSFLCVGLDPDITRIPVSSGSTADRIIEFNKQIIDATKDHCVAYKPNTAFYEMYGSKGWDALEQTIDYIPDSHFVIADAKRGDIGNTSKKYAAAFFDHLKADAVTVAPYMGVDSISPFLEHKDKWVVLLALTSNKGSNDFQQLVTTDNQKVYNSVILKSKEWGTPDNLMYVVGATHPKEFEQIRALIPDHFLLVPGIGAQGGNLQEVCKYGMNDDIGLLINVSRGILYAGDDENYAEAAQKEAKRYHVIMINIF